MLPMMGEQWFGGKEQLSDTFPKGRLMIMKDICPSGQVWVIALDRGLSVGIVLGFC